MYEAYLRALLAPLGVYDLTAGSVAGAELCGLAAGLDGVSAALETAERESLTATATGTGLDRRESLFARKSAAVTPEERRKAIAALLCIDGDSLTPAAIDQTILGCGIRARALEMGQGKLRVVFPDVGGEPPEFEQIRDIILDILPCHLEVEFYFRYLTWDECERGEYTWNTVEAAGYSWDTFQMSPPPEA